MRDVSNLELYELLDITQRLKLVTDYHVTDWSISVYVGETPFVMTPVQARAFVQGLLIGHCIDTETDQKPRPRKYRSERPLSWLSA